MKELLESDSTTRTPREGDWSTFRTENGGPSATKISARPKPPLPANKWDSPEGIFLAIKLSPGAFTFAKATRGPITADKTPSLLLEKSLAVPEKNRL